MDTFTTNQIIELKTLKTKAKMLIESYSQPHLPENRSILAGGCFSSWLHNEAPKDFDIFLLDTTPLDVAVVDIKSLSEKERYVIHDNQTYLKNPNILVTILDNITKIQYIYTKYNNRRELIDHFDMKGCCVSYDITADELYISPATYEAISHKKIIPNNGNSIEPWRIERYKSKGWAIGFDDKKIPVQADISFTSLKESLIQKNRKGISASKIPLSGSEFDWDDIDWSLKPITIEY